MSVQSIVQNIPYRRKSQVFTGPVLLSGSHQHGIFISRDDAYYYSGILRVLAGACKDSISPVDVSQLLKLADLLASGGTL